MAISDFAIKIFDELFNDWCSISSNYSNKIRFAIKSEFLKDEQKDFLKGQLNLIIFFKKSKTRSSFNSN